MERYNTIEEFIDEEMSCYYDEEEEEFASEIARLEKEETAKVYELEDDDVDRWYVGFYEINVDETESVYMEFDCNGFGSDEAFYDKDGDIIPEYDEFSPEFDESNYTNPNPQYKHEAYGRLMKGSEPITNWYGYDLEIGNEDWRVGDYDSDAHFEYFGQDYAQAQYVLYKYLEKKYKEGKITKAA